jgi:hypothetical protein
MLGMYKLTTSSLVMLRPAGSLTATRSEKYLLGVADIPKYACYGIQV